MNDLLQRAIEVVTGLVGTLASFFDLEDEAAQNDAELLYRLEKIILIYLQVFALGDVGIELMSPLAGNVAYMEVLEHPGASIKAMYRHDRTGYLLRINSWGGNLDESAMNAYSDSVHAVAVGAASTDITNEIGSRPHYLEFKFWKLRLAGGTEALVSVRFELHATSMKVVGFSRHHNATSFGGTINVSRVLLKTSDPKRFGQTVQPMIALSLSMRNALPRLDE